MYSVNDIAKYFLYRENANPEAGELISNLKLQKLVYYAQGIHLAMTGKPLFSEPILAWQYGPVVESLYHYYKEYGAGNIPAPQDFDPSVIDPATTTFLDEVFNVFGQFSAIRLMELTHSDECWGKTEINKEITHNLMRSDLKKYLKNG